MVMPVLSVTAVGLVAAAVAVLGGRWPLGVAAGRGILGAWAGFAAGALFGLAVDVALREGVFVAVVGHIAAVVGAVAALSTRAGRQGHTSRPR